MFNGRQFYDNNSNIKVYRGDLIWLEKNPKSISWMENPILENNDYRFTNVGTVSDNWLVNKSIATPTQYVDLQSFDSQTSQAVPAKFQEINDDKGAISAIRTVPIKLYNGGLTTAAGAISTEYAEAQNTETISKTITKIVYWMGRKARLLGITVALATTILLQVVGTNQHRETPLINININNNFSNNNFCILVKK